MAKRFEKWKKWFENYWYHYNIQTWLVLVFIISGVILVTNFFQKKDADFVVVYAGSAYGSEAQFDSVKDTIYETVGDLNADGKVHINYRIIAIREGGLSNYNVNKQQEFNYSFLDKGAQLYIIEDKYAKDKAAYFEPLTGLLPPEVMEGGLKNENGEVFAVPLSGKKIAREMDFDRENIYIAVKTTMDRERDDAFAMKGKEKARALLQYIVNG